MRDFYFIFYFIPKKKGKCGKTEKALFQDPETLNIMMRKCYIKELKWLMELGIRGPS